MEKKVGFCTNQTEESIWTIRSSGTWVVENSAEGYEERRKKRDGCDTKDSSCITEESQRELIKMAISTLYFILAHPIHSARNDQIHFFPSPVGLIKMPP